MSSLLAAIPIMAAPGAHAQVAIGERAPRTDTPSGYPVPRFVSLKSSKTYCRLGPSFGHPVRFTYQRTGLPLLVIAETRDHWRKVRDSEGDECWVHGAKLSGRDTALVLEEGLPLRARPQDGGRLRARLGRGVIADIEASREGWVRLSTGVGKGWTRASALWGVDIESGISRPRN